MPWWGPGLVSSSSRVQQASGNDCFPTLQPTPNKRRKYFRPKHHLSQFSGAWRQPPLLPAPMCPGNPAPSPIEGIGHYHAKVGWGGGAWRMHSHDEFHPMLDWGSGLIDNDDLTMGLSF